VVRKFIAVACAASMAGCAVLQVDVDVYKGPLSNQRGVQVEQVAAMAMGAKPLLIQLRDRLEETNEDQRRNWIHGKETTRHHPKHAYGYIKAGLFHDSAAERVNAILSLYVPQANTSGLRSVAMESALNAYLAAFQELNPADQNLNDSEVRWRAIDATCALPPRPTPPAGAAVAAIDDSKWNDAWEELRKAYGSLIAPTKGLTSDPVRVLSAYAKLIERYNDLKNVVTSEQLKVASQQYAGMGQLVALMARTEALKLRKPPEPEFQVEMARIGEEFKRTADAEPALKEMARYLREVNAWVESVPVPKSVDRAWSPVADADFERAAAYMELSKAEVVQRHASALIPKPENRPALLSAATQRAGSYVPARDSLVKMFLALIQRLGAGGDDASETAEALSQIVSVPHLLSALQLSQVHADARDWEDVAELRRMMHDAGLPALSKLRDDNMCWLSVRNDADPTVAICRASLVGASHVSAARVAAGLLQSHQRLLTLSNTDRQVLIDGFAAPPFSDKATIWGVVGAPTRREQQFNIARAVQALAGGLERGRERDGLERLIEGYIVARHDDGQPSEEEDRLLRALVNFAQKVSMLGNMAQLVDGDSQPHAEQSSSDLPKESLRSYRWTLQAVSNSIITQIDDLRASQHHAKKELDGGPTYTQALRLAANGDSATSFARLTSAVDARKRTFGDQKLQAQKDRDRAQAAAAGIAGAKESSPAESGIANIALALRRHLNATLSNAATPDESTRCELALKEFDQRSEALIKHASDIELVGKVPATFVSARDLWKLDLEKIAAEAEIRAKAAETVLSDWTQAGSALVASREKVLAALDATAGDSARDVSARVLRAEGKTAEADAILNLPKVDPAFPVNTATTNTGAADVLAAQISLLRVQQAYAAIDGTPEQTKERRDSIGEAIHALEAARSALIYIRPASTYLRNSYPVTSLQGNAPLSWTNLLARHQARTTPLFGERLARRQEGLDDPKYVPILAEIDKQFWQSVNRIRVAGGGKTNYAVAKDDVGNWYVKSYSTDKQSIINSAKNLALFGLKSQIGAGALSNSVKAQDAQKAADTSGGTSTKSKPAPAGAVDSQIAAFDVRSLEVIVRDYRDIRTAAEQFAKSRPASTATSSETVKAIAKAHDDAALDPDFAEMHGVKDTELENVLEILSDAKSTDDLKTLKAAATRLSTDRALRACRRYYSSVNLQLVAAGTPSAAEDQTALSKAKAWAKAFGTETLSLAQRHRANLQSLESTLGIIGNGIAQAK